MRRGSQVWQSGLDSSGGFTRWCSGPPGPQQAEMVTAFKPANNCWLVTPTVRHYFICERGFCSTSKLQVAALNARAQLNTPGANSVRYLLHKNP